MEFLSVNWLVEHLARFFIIILGIVFAIILGRYRAEWRSRKTLICWVWTIIAADIVIMDGEFALSVTAQLFIGGALLLNVINFIGDRIETIKFKDFSMSLDKDIPSVPDQTTPEVAVPDKNLTGKDNFTNKEGE